MTRLLSSLAGVALLVAVGFLGGRCSVEPPTDERVTTLATILGLQARELDSLRPLAARKDSIAVVTEDRWRTVTKEVRELVPAGLPVPWPVFVRVLETGDTALSSCTAAREACGDVARKERARADSTQVLADAWKAKARGPWLQLAGEAALGGGAYGGLDASVRLDGPWRVFGRLEQRLDSAGRELRVGIRRPF